MITTEHERRYWQSISASRSRWVLLLCYACLYASYTLLLLPAAFLFSINSLSLFLQAPICSHPLQNLVWSSSISYLDGCFCSHSVVLLYHEGKLLQLPTHVSGFPCRVLSTSTSLRLPCKMPSRQESRLSSRGMMLWQKRILPLQKASV